MNFFDKLRKKGRELFPNLLRYAGLSPEQERLYRKYNNEFSPQDAVAFVKAAIDFPAPFFEEEKGKDFRDTRACSLTFALDSAMRIALHSSKQTCKTVKIEFLPQLVSTGLYREFSNGGGHVSTRASVDKSAHLDRDSVVTSRGVVGANALVLNSFVAGSVSDGGTISNCCIKAGTCDVSAKKSETKLQVLENIDLTASFSGPPKIQNNSNVMPRVYPLTAEESSRLEALKDIASVVKKPSPITTEPCGMSGFKSMLAAMKELGVSGASKGVGKLN